MWHAFEVVTRWFTSGHPEQYLWAGRLRAVSGCRFGQRCCASWLACRLTFPPPPLVASQRAAGGRPAAAARWAADRQLLVLPLLSLCRVLLLLLVLRLRRGCRGGAAAEGQDVAAEGGERVPEVGRLLRPLLRGQGRRCRSQSESKDEPITASGGQKAVPWAKLLDTSP